MVQMKTYFCKIMLIILSIFSTGSISEAQKPETQINKFSAETRKNLINTQDLIQSTRTKLNLVQTQNKARAREIEALTNKVGIMITKMSGQGQDNTALQSEISVLDELLTVERKITGDLRVKNIQLRNELNIIKTHNNTIKKHHAKVIEKNKKKQIKTNNQLKIITDKMARREQKNNILKNDIKTLATEVVRLRKQIKLLKKNRYRSKLRNN